MKITEQAIMNKKTILLLSGGLDSTVAGLIALKSKHQISAITIDYGQPARSKEIKAAKIFCKNRKIKHSIIKLPWYRNLSKPFDPKTLPTPTYDNLDKFAKKTAKTVWLPQRNLIFLSIASGIAEANSANTIIAGLNSEEGKTFPDNSISFIKSFQKTLHESSFVKIKFYVPTAKWTKTRILKEGLNLGLKANEIWSCYRNNNIMCGKCESCMRLKRAAKHLNCLDFLKGKTNEI